MTPRLRRCVSLETRRRDISRIEAATRALRRLTGRSSAALLGTDEHIEQAELQGFELVQTHDGGRLPHRIVTRSICPSGLM